MLIQNVRPGYRFFSKFHGCTLTVESVTPVGSYVERHPNVAAKVAHISSAHKRSYTVIARGFKMPVELSIYEDDAL